LLARECPRLWPCMADVCVSPQRPAHDRSAPWRALCRFKCEVSRPLLDFFTSTYTSSLFPYWAPVRVRVGPLLAGPIAPTLPLTNAEGLFALRHRWAAFTRRMGCNDAACVGRFEGRVFPCCKALALDMSAECDPTFGSVKRGFALFRSARAAWVRCCFLLVCPICRPAESLRCC